MIKNMKEKNDGLNRRFYVNSLVINITWEFLSTVGSSVIVFVTSLLLARILIPKDFGIYGYIQIILSLSLLVLDVGIGHTVVRTQKKRIEDTAFWFCTFLSLIFFFSVYLLAPYIALFFKEPNLRSLLRVASLSFLLTPYSSIQNAIEVKNMRFKKSFLYNISFVLGSSISTILMALNGFGVWSFILGYLIGYICKTIITLIYGSWHPSLNLKREDLKEISRFTGYFTFHDIVSWLTTYLDDLLVGRFLGASALGYYRVGFELGRTPASIVAGPLNKVFFSFYSKLQKKRELLINFYLLSLRILLTVLLPIGILLLIFAEEIIIFLLGYKWLKAAVVVRFIAIYGIFAGIGGNITLLLRSVGKPELTFKLQLFRAPILISAYLYTAPKGLLAISIAHAVIISGSIFIYILLAFKVIEINYTSFSYLLKPMMNVLILSFLMIGSKVVFTLYLPSYWLLFFIIIILLGGYFSIVVLKEKETFAHINRIMHQ